MSEPDLSTHPGVDRKESARFLAEFMLREAIRQSERQEAHFDELRRRGVAMLSATALAMALVGSVGLREFQTPSIIMFAVALFLLIPALMLVVYLQLRVEEWGVGFSTKSFLENLDEWLRLPVEEIQVRAADFLEKRLENNRKAVEKRSRAFYWSLGFETTTFLLLLSSVMISLIE